ncbi:MAG: OB-fold protein [Bacteroidia bacterium]
MKKWLIAVIIIILAIGGTVYYVFNKPKRDIAGSKEDFVITAPALLQEFETDETAANTKYLDKIIAVKGQIASIETTQEGNLNIALATNNEMSTVSCAMLPDEKHKAANIKPGDEFTIKGLCTGMLMDVVLTNCSFVTNP